MKNLKPLPIYQESSYSFGGTGEEEKGRGGWSDGCGWWGWQGSIHIFIVYLALQLTDALEACAAENLNLLPIECLIQCADKIWAKSNPNPRCGQIFYGFVRTKIARFLDFWIRDSTGLSQVLPNLNPSPNMSRDLFRRTSNAIFLAVRLPQTTVWS